MPLDDSQELFYQVDEHDQVIGSIPRSQAHSNKTIIHRSIGILLINDKNQMLFQKRSFNKDLYPGEWTYAVGGHVTYGDSYEKTAHKEISEELGIQNAEIVFLTKVFYFTGVETQMAGIFKVQIPSKTVIHLDKDEVKEILWINIDKIPQFIASHTVANWTIEALKKTGYLHSV